MSTADVVGGLMLAAGLLGLLASSKYPVFDWWTASLVVTVLGDGLVIMPTFGSDDEDSRAPLVGWKSNSSNNLQIFQG